MQKQCYIQPVLIIGSYDENNIPDAMNAAWDKDFKIDEIIDDYLKHITDPKPITARQCIASLPKIAKNKPDLKEDILRALSRADISRYPDSMCGLVFKDIQNALREVEKF